MAFLIIPPFSLNNAFKSKPIHVIKISRSWKMFNKAQHKKFYSSIHDTNISTFGTLKLIYNALKINHDIRNTLLMIMSIMQEFCDAIPLNKYDFQALKIVSDIEKGIPFHKRYDKLQNNEAGNETNLFFATNVNDKISFFQAWLLTLFINDVTSVLNPLDKCSS